MSISRFLLGFAVGMGVGMLFAPASGEETRDLLAERAREWMEISQRKIEEKVEEAAQVAKAKAGDLGSQIGRQAAENAVQTVERNVLGKNKTA
ncbi:MAG TPA: YtxH domain-containing protein [Candidatus Sulfotelmatobacter sp.]|nr:YtxH domain-containing protein [Candidatus Sulfotelmatobacter sp.]